MKTIFCTDYDYDGNFVIFTRLEDEDEEDFYETPEQRSKEHYRSELYREYVKNGGTLSWDEFQCKLSLDEFHEWKTK